MRTLALISLLASTVASAQAPEHNFNLMDGVVVDTERGELYLMTPEGQVEAVSLQTGKVKWTTDAAAKPLLKHGDLLFSQVDSSGGKKQLRIVALDTTKKGRASTKCEPIELPRWAPDGVDQPLGGQLSVEARWAPDIIYIVWTAQTQWVGNGAPPPDVQRGGMHREGSGIVRCDLVSGTLMGAGPDVPAPPKAPRQPKDDTVSDFTRTSADELHYLKGHSNDAASDHRRYTWLVHDAATEKLLHTVPNAEAVGPFLVAGDAIIYNSTEPSYAIRALHPATSTILWARPLRPTWYRGPLPD